MTYGKGCLGRAAGRAMRGHEGVRRHQDEAWCDEVVLVLTPGGGAAVLGLRLLIPKFPHSSRCMRPLRVLSTPGSSTEETLYVLLHPTLQVVSAELSAWRRRAAVLA
jgi:hypothetical protein